MFAVQKPQETPPLPEGQIEILPQEFAQALAEVMVATRDMIRGAYKVPAMTAVFTGPRHGISGTELDTKGRKLIEGNASERAELSLREAIKTVAEACPGLFEIFGGERNSQSPIDWIRVHSGDPIKLPAEIQATVVTIAFELAKTRIKAEGSTPTHTLQEYQATFDRLPLPLAVCKENLEAMGVSSEISRLDKKGITAKEWAEGLAKAIIKKLEITDTSGNRETILAEFFMSPTGHLTKQECYEAIAEKEFGVAFAELERTEKHTMQVAVDSALKSIVKRIEWIDATKSGNVVLGLQLKEKTTLDEDTIRLAINLAYTEACTRLEGRQPSGKDIAWFREHYSGEKYPVATVIAPEPTESPTTKFIKNKEAA